MVLVAEFLLFCVSAGFFFTHLRDNKFAFAIAGLIAIGSTISLGDWVWSLCCLPQTPTAQVVPVQAPAASVAAPAAAMPSPATTDPVVIEIAFWNSVDKNNSAQLQAYLDRYPNGQFVSVARSRLQLLLNPPAPTPVPVIQKAAETAQNQASAPQPEHKKICVNFNNQTICDSN